MSNQPADLTPPAAPSPSEIAARPAESTLRRFFMTADLRAATGLTRTHLDFYLREGIILPTARTESGYLLFDDAELDLLHQVIAWRQTGVSIRAIRSRLGRLPIDDMAATDD